CWCWRGCSEWILIVIGVLECLSAPSSALPEKKNISLRLRSRRDFYLGRREDAVSDSALESRIVTGGDAVVAQTSRAVAAV
ncbi:hypothetical protein PENTCL1PPCAC_14334, partial [Pristionchus entomophagus]